MKTILRVVTMLPSLAATADAPAAFEPAAALRDLALRVADKAQWQEVASSEQLLDDYSPADLCTRSLLRQRPDLQKNCEDGPPSDRSPRSSVNASVPLSARLNHLVDLGKSSPWVKDPEKLFALLERSSVADQPYCAKSRRGGMSGLLEQLVAQRRTSLLFVGDSVMQHVFFK